MIAGDHRWWSAYQQNERRMMKWVSTKETKDNNKETTTETKQKHTPAQLTRSTQTNVSDQIKSSFMRDNFLQWNIASMPDIAKLLPLETPMLHLHRGVQNWLLLGVSSGKCKRWNLGRLPSPKKTKCATFMSPAWTEKGDGAVWKPGLCRHKFVPKNTKACSCSTPLPTAALGAEMHLDPSSASPEETWVWPPYPTKNPKNLWSQPGFVMRWVLPSSWFLKSINPLIHNTIYYRL